MHYHQTACLKLERLATQCWERYDLVVLCDNDIPYDDTWERSGDVNRHELQAFNRQYLKEHGIKHILASGDLRQRKQTVLKSLGLVPAEMCLN
jgi:nicotinamide riboside kinase